MNVLALGLVFIPMILGIFLYLLDSKKSNRFVFIFQLIFSLGIILLIYKLHLCYNYSWVIGDLDKIAGIEISLDNISLTFMGMTNIGIWIIFLYSWDEKAENTKFWFFIEFIQGALYMLFIVNDLFSMFVGFELVTILSSLMILLKKDSKSLKASLYYLLYNSVGMIFYLLGIILLYVKIGTLNIDLVHDAVEVLGYTPELLLCYGLFITAFCLKSAVVPMSSWLPLAHSSAMTPISAFLSGLLVKIGVYGFIRIQMMMPIYDMNSFLLIVGIVTALFGIFMAIIDNDMKRILAFSTISQMGLIIISLTGQEIASSGTMLHLINHFFSKSLLFLIVGTIITLTKERDIRKIKSLYQYSPMLSFALIIAILSMTGAPLSAGALSKFLVKKNYYDTNISAFFYLMNLGTMAVYFRFIKILMGDTIKRASLLFKQKLVFVMMSLVIIVSVAIEAIVIDTKLLHKWLNFGNIISELGIYFLFLIIIAIGYRKLKLSHRAIVRYIRSRKLTFPEATGAVIFFWFMIIVQVYYSVKLK
jgi:multicomponent Na+:H+ antiporter subunit D